MAKKQKIITIKKAKDLPKKLDTILYKEDAPILNQGSKYNPKYATMQAGDPKEDTGITAQYVDSNNIEELRRKGIIGALTPEIGKGMKNGEIAAYVVRPSGVKGRFPSHGMENRPKREQVLSFDYVDKKNETLESGILTEIMNHYMDYVADGKPKTIVLTGGLETPEGFEKQGRLNRYVDSLLHKLYTTATIHRGDAISKEDMYKKNMTSRPEFRDESDIKKFANELVKLNYKKELEKTPGWKRGLYKAGIGAGIVGDAVLGFFGVTGGISAVNDYSTMLQNTQWKEAKAFVDTGLVGPEDSDYLPIINGCNEYDAAFQKLPVDILIAAGCLGGAAATTYVGLKSRFKLIQTYVHTSKDKALSDRAKQGAGLHLNYSRNVKDESGQYKLPFTSMRYHENGGKELIPKAGEYNPSKYETLEA